MSRLSRAALVFLVAVFCAGEIGTLSRPANAQSTVPTRGPSLPRTVHATPPPLPFGATPSSSTSAGMPVPADHVLPPSFDPSKPLAKSLVYPVNVPPLPSKAPKLSSALRRYKGRRAPAAANGSTIILTGDQANFYLNDQTLPYDAQVFFLCQNMTPSSTYRYVMYPPTQTSVASGNITTNASGQCKTSGGTDEYFNTSLATPVGSPTPVSAYPGVWAVAMERITTGGAHIAWDSVAYFVVISTLNFNSYSDAADTTVATQFTPGSTAYFNAGGLTPNHSYVFGVAYTAADPMNCVYMQPVVTVLPTGGGTCFTSPASGGNVPFNGTFSGAWAIPSNAATGTYSIQLYDATTQDLVSTQQISVQQNTTTIALQPYSGTPSNTGVNLNDTFATDGFMQVNGVLTPEQSVSGLNVGMTLPAPGFVAGHTYSLALSDPNGAVLTNAFVDNQTFGPAQTFTATGTTSTQSFNFPINTAFFTGIGPTLTSFAPNVMTMQLFDRTAGTVLGSKSFVVLAYQALFGWTSPVGQTVTAQPGGTAVVATVSNTAAGLYGSWNGDGIKQFVIAKDSGNNVSIALNGTSATDSVGQAWNFSINAAGSLVATPAVAGTFLPSNATLAIPMTLSVPSIACSSSACLLPTSITPQHGIAASGNSVASNALMVFGPGGSASKSTPTYSWQVTASPTGLTPSPPRYAQIMYRQGTEGITSGNYAVNVNVTSCGATQNIEELRFTLPAAFDADVAGQAPTLTKAVIGGTTQTNWTLYTKLSGGGNRQNSLQQNEFAIGCTGSNAVNGCGIPFSTSSSCNAGNAAVFTLSWPIPKVAFPMQDVVATANWQGGCATTCGMPSFNIGPVQQLTNLVAGATNVDSTELGFYSLDGTTMTGVMSPSTVGQGAAVTSNFQFTNTSPTADAAPDYVDEIQLDIPNGAIPNSITVPANWFQNGAPVNDSGATGKIYTFSVCSGTTPPPCGVSAPTAPSGAEPNALAPGATVGFTFNYSSAPFPALGTYSIKWTAYGANGGANTTAASDVATLTFANTVAQISWADIGGGNGTIAGIPTMTPVGANAQATVGSDWDPSYGNSFVMNVFNNGTQTLTGMKITIPVDDVNANKPTDTAHDWQLSGVNVLAGQGAAPNCSGAVPAANIVLPNTGTNTPGSITLSGCALAPGATLQLFFRSSAPYDQPGHFYRFNGTVTSALQANAPTQTAYANSDTVLVIADAQLRVYIPTSSAAGLPDGQGTGGTFPTTCPGCSFIASPAAVDLGTFTGTFNGSNLINAAVTSDTTGAHGWQLYVGITSSTGTASGAVSGMLDAANKSVNANYTGSLTAMTAIPNTNPGVLVGSLTGAASFNHAAVQNPMDFRVTLPVFPAALTPGSDSVTLTYTLIPN